MTGSRPTGQRYSLTYLEPGSPVEHSPRLQRRIGEFFFAQLRGVADHAVTALKVELGAQMRSNPDAYMVRSFFFECTPTDFLEAITIIARVVDGLDKRYGSNPAQRKIWIDFVARAFEEENFAFEVDKAGGIHPRVDAAFQANKTEAVTMLGAPRYASALAHFRGAYVALDGPAPATSRAIREIHLAVEDVFKLVVPNASRFDAGEASRFKAALSEHFSGPELEALKLMMAAAADYSSASHQYRHAPGTEEPQPASMNTAILMVSQGTSILRWFVALDQTALRRTAAS